MLSSASSGGGFWHRRLVPLVDAYEELLTFSGFQARVHFSGPTRALRGDAAEPFQSWEWSGNEFVRLFFGIGGQLPRLIGPQHTHRWLTHR